MASLTDHVLLLEKTLQENGTVPPHANYPPKTRAKALVPQTTEQTDKAQSTTSQQVKLHRRVRLIHPETVTTDFRVTTTYFPSAGPRPILHHKSKLRRKRA